MSPYRIKGRQVWYLNIPRGDGTYYRPTSETRDRATAFDMQRMLDSFGRRGNRQGQWILEQLLAKRFRVPQVYDHWVAGTLEQLREQLADVDLAPTIDQWAAQVTQALAPTTVRKYLAHAALLFPVGADGQRLPAWRSQLNRARVEAVLASNPSLISRKRIRASWLSVFRYLMDRGVLGELPIAASATGARGRRATEVIHLADWGTAEAFVRAHKSEKLQALAALRHGAGVEFKAAREVTPASVRNWTERIIYVPGTKSSARSREVQVKPWAWRILEPVLRSALPHVKVLYANERRAWKAHHDALAELRAQGRNVPATYTMHHARHTFAVNAMKDGDDPKYVQANLGHSNLHTTLTTYGRYQPRVTEFVRAGAAGGRGQ